MANEGYPGMANRISSSLGWLEGLRGDVLGTHASLYADGLAGSAPTIPDFPKIGSGT